MATYQDRILVLDSTSQVTRPLPADTVQFTSITDLNGNVTVSGTATYNHSSSGAVTHTGNPTIDTGSGAFTHSGAVSLAANIGVTALAGSGAFDFGVGTGIFRSSTGANTLMGDVTITGAKTFATGTGAISLNGDSTVASGKSITATGGASALNFSASSGAFSTSTGAVGINGAVTVAANKNLSVAAGTSAFDFSGGSGIFTTSGGAVTIGPGAVGVSGAATFSASGTGLTVTNNALVSGNLSVSGDLTVVGAFTSTTTEIVNINDNTLYLNNAYTANAAQTGGLVVNYLPSATTTTVAAGGFVAGVAATSNPTVATVGVATFAAGDLIQISSATQAQNNGLFEVLTHAANLLTIRGIGTSAAVLDFTQNQFVTSAGAAGSIFKVAVSAMRAGTDGLWEAGAGSTNALTFTDVALISSASLQNSYNGGATITTAASTPIAFTLASGGFTINGAGAVDIGSAGTDVSSFAIGTGTFAMAATSTVTVSGTALSYDGSAASHLNTTGANLTVSTTTSGTLAVSSAGALNLSSVAGTWQASGAVAIESTLGALSIGANADAQPINIGTGAAARTMSIGTGAAAYAVTMGSVTGAATTTIQAGTGGVSVKMIDNQNAAFLVKQGTDVYIGVSTVDGLEQVNIGNVALGTSTINIATNAQAHAVNVGTGAGGTAQTVIVGSQSSTSSLQLDAGTGNISIGQSASARSVNIATGGAAQVVTLGSLSGASSLTLQAGTGNIAINGSLGTTLFTVKDAQASTFTVANGATSYITVDSVAAKAVKLSQFVQVVNSGGVSVVASGALTAGDVVYLKNTAGAVNASLADADATGKKIPAGVAFYNAADTAACYIASMNGSMVPVHMDAAPAAASIGSIVYLDAVTAGRGTLSAPATTGSSVYRLGILAQADGATATVNVLWQPQFIANNP